VRDKWLLLKKRWWQKKKGKRRSSSNKMALIKKGSRRAGVINQPKPAPLPKKRASSTTMTEVIMLQCNEEPNCQCSLRRGLFLPPGLEEVENRNDSADPSSSKKWDIGEKLAGIELKLSRNTVCYTGIP
jgi:hypothetical protein